MVVNGKVILPSEIHGQLVTDASQTGWGGHYGTEITQGFWDPTMSQKHSNVREWMAVLLSIRAFQVLIKKQNNTNFIRQHYYSGLHKSYGWANRVIDRNCEVDMGGGHSTQHNSSSSTSEWKTKHSSRRSFERSRQTRMDASKTNVPVSRLSLGTPHNRQICLGNLYTTACLQLKVPRPKWYENGRTSTKGLVTRK